MSKKPASAATIEEMISDLCYWEDPKAPLLITATESGGVCILDQDWPTSCGEGETVEKALLSFVQSLLKNHPTVLDESGLDWTT